MPALKKFLKSSVAQGAAARLLSLYIRLVFITNRKIQMIDPAAERIMRGEDNALFAFWHGRMMMLPAFCPPKRQMRVLISRHRDGSLISQVIAHFGQATVTGSSSKGGKEAAAEILNALEAGDNIGITPDGPRGPAEVATKGTLSLARLSQKPILPVTFAASRVKRLSSWDRFALALPFGRIVFCVGAPFLVPEEISEEEEEQLLLAFEQTMNQLVDAAEARLHG